MIRISRQPRKYVLADGSIKTCIVNVPYHVKNPDCHKKKGVSVVLTEDETKNILDLWDNTEYPTYAGVSRAYNKKYEKQITYYVLRKCVLSRT